MGGGEASLACCQLGSRGQCEAASSTRSPSAAAPTRRAGPPLRSGRRLTFMRSYLSSLLQPGYKLAGV